MFDSIKRHWLAYRNMKAIQVSARRMLRCESAIWEMLGSSPSIDQLNYAVVPLLMELTDIRSVMLTSDITEKLEILEPKIRNIVNQYHDSDVKAMINELEKKHGCTEI